MTRAVELRTARLVVRPVTLADVDALHAYRGDLDVARFLPHAPLDIDDARRLVERACERWRAPDGERFNLLFALARDDDVIGDVHAWNTDEPHQPASADPGDVWIGFALHPREQRNVGFTEHLRYTADEDATGKHAASVRLRLDRAVAHMLRSSHG